VRPAGDPKIWRKQLRREAKGEKKGRRQTHRVEIQPPRKGSTWVRRHKGVYGWDAYTIYRERAQ